MGTKGWYYRGGNGKWEDIVTYPGFGTHSIAKEQDG